MAKEIVIGVIAVLALTAGITMLYQPVDQVGVHFDSFVAEFGRSYKTAEEYEFRKQVFGKALEFIEKFNSEGHTWTVGVNQFADMTHEEVKQHMGYTPSNFKSDKVLGTITAESDSGPNDQDIDWRQRKYTRPVKNQGSCGSCWAFAANAGVEAAWKKYNVEKLHAHEDFPIPNLSEQLLNDCDPLSGGCMGGFMVYAYYYYTQNLPALEENYPYVARDLDCRADKVTKAFDKHLEGWYDISAYNDEALRKALNLDVVPVAIQAENESFYRYTGGIISGTECGYRLDHGVALVAEKIHQDGSKVWTIRNSWGANWGEQGHARIAREVQTDRFGNNVGVCGINTDNDLPTFYSYWH